MAIFGGKQLRAPTTRVNHSAARRQERHYAVEARASFPSKASHFPSPRDTRGRYTAGESACFSGKCHVWKIPRRSSIPAQQPNIKHSHCTNIYKRKYPVSLTYVFTNISTNLGPSKTCCGAMFRVSLSTPAKSSHADTYARIKLSRVFMHRQG